jgi:thiol:disulfide interchange protein DsbA
MRRLQQLLCIGALLVSFGASAAEPAVAAPKSFPQYRTLSEVQNTDANGKIEVTEFFAYYCPHCSSLEPRLAEWVKQQGDKIVFKRVHVSGPQTANAQQRLYYTLDSLGLQEQYHNKVFDAIHGQHLRLGSDEQVMEWLPQAGIDPAKYSAAAHSFGLQAKLRRANALMASYQIDYWPQIAIDGHYLTSPAQVGEATPELVTEVAQQEAALKVMDFLVTKAQAEKKH